MEKEIASLEIRLSTPFQLLERKPDLKILYALQSERSAFRHENILPNDFYYNDQSGYKKR